MSQISISGDASLSEGRAGVPAWVLAGCFTLAGFGASFLLFLVEPMFARMVLPKLGGTPAVWNTCMVFFQGMLLAGYLYSHLLTRHLSKVAQVGIHALVLAGAGFCLPISMRADWSAGGSGPAWAVLGLMVSTVGGPFFVLATTSPLLQRWFARSEHPSAANPYFLYAAGNVGSLLALVGYPAVVEPMMRVVEQARAWAWGYGLFAVAVFVCGVMGILSGDRAVVLGGEDEARPTVGRRIRWIVLAAVPSSYLMGVTTFMTTDIAAVPLFWVVPLGIYLVSFVVVFRVQGLGFRVQGREEGGNLGRLLPVGVLGVVLFVMVHAARPVWLVLGVHLVAFLLACLVCHGELARSRPGAGRLTEFYLMMSLGGVIGGMFNALVAPMLFRGPWEYPLAIVATCWVAGEARRLRWMDAAKAIAVVGVALVGPGVLAGSWRVGPLVILLGVGLPVLGCFVMRKNRGAFTLGVTGLLAVAVFHVQGGGRVLESRRSFFGVHRVVASADGFSRVLYHGSTIHGRQDGRRTSEPLTYYHRSGPAGDVFARLGHRRVALVGLGVGSLSAYAEAGDVFDCYEIDREVKWAAEESGYFSYMKDARARGARVEVRLGDARLELAKANEKYDLIVLDAFSGDSVPVHLLTREAMEMYLRKLAPGGAIAVHVSNIYIDLKPVVGAVARETGCVAMFRDDIDVTTAEQEGGKSPSQWMVVAHEGGGGGAVGWERFEAGGATAWTDDFSDIVSVMRWGR